MTKTNKIAAALTAAYAVGMSAPALAEVQIYGTLMEFLDNYKTTGATSGTPSGAPNQVKSYPGTTVPAETRVNAGTSNIGFKGIEDLGSGLKVVWQVESQVNVDGSEVPPSTFGSRNSRVGLATAQWGTLFAGNWDTPYKSAYIDIAPLNTLNPFDNIIIGNPGFGVPGTTTQAGRANSKADAAFDRRQGNSLQYWSPTIAGFSLRADYSFGEGHTSPTSSVPGINPSLWSASLLYAYRNFNVRYAYERHNDYFGLSQLGGSAGASSTNASSKDDGNVLTLDYQLPSTRLGLVMERLSYHNDDSVLGAVNNYKRNAWFALIKQSFGLHDVWGTYGKAYSGSCSVVGGGNCSTNGLSATQWSLGYDYNLSKRTKLYAAYYGINNQTSASYVIAGAPAGSTSPGSDTRGIGLGMSHAF